jgi:hypothetical protein
MEKKRRRRGILIFPLPEDENDFEIAVNAMDWALTSWDMDKWLREKLKYGHKFKSASEALEAVRDELRTILAEHNLNLDMIE